MHIRSLNLTHFRSHRAGDYTFSANINCLYGENGVGKTNLLDALHYLCLTKGLHPDKDALTHNETFFNINATVEDSYETYSLKCHYMQGKGKKVLLNNKPLPRLSDHIGSLPVVLVLPEDTDLIRQGSTLRRKWLDGCVSQVSQDYLRALLAYDKAVKQRNALLDRLKATGYPSDIAEHLAPWDHTMASHAPLIHRMRVEFMEDFLPHFSAQHRTICQEQEVASLAYLPQSVWADEQTVLQELRHHLPADMAAGRTTRGVHKEDVRFELNHTAIRPYGSQGQQKSFVLALKLAQIPFLLQYTHKAPILLLDDIFDKLDPVRTQAIAQLLDDYTGQVFVTNPDLDRLQRAFQSATREVSYIPILKASS